ncbi:GH92 family glycosyl hydrolase [Persicobacter diffluens]|uniref:Glycoside hydrolase family 92 protein n=1 Tax=Persicobacter diffluens TaxID=981 RepID=A0AAN4W180_9BACT|nr:hypothetical protein PEDI_29990 [Persicobacter diffluens]
MLNFFGNKAGLKFLAASFLLLQFCSPKGQQSLPEAPALVSKVNPMIGTGGHGHTFPGATTPHGMVQLSPDTGNEGWDWSSGYHISDSSIMGFSHTHLSGTGGGDYGDILLMPFTGVNHWEAGSKKKPEAGYRSAFSHEEEFAQPGFYSVKLQQHNIDVALTATPRTGFHQYTFNGEENPKVILDLVHGIGDNIRELELTITGDHEVSGLRRSQGWARDQYVYFVLQFSQPIRTALLNDGQNVSSEIKSLKGQNIKAIFEFEKSDDPLLAKVALSAVSVDGARRNMEAENNGWDWGAVKNQAQALWEKELQKATVKGGTEDEQSIFYTAAYHTMIHPNIYMDVDHQYRGMDQKIHTAEGFDYYTLFSLWDTFRAAHPWYSIVEPSRNVDFINTLLAKYKESGELAVWELASNETGTMIGYHAVPVIADAIIKGTKGFDYELAFEAMKNSATTRDRGIDHLMDLGFIPYDWESNSVSKLVEYAFDDWCIAESAKILGKTADYEAFSKRALNYRKLFDASTGFFRGRSASGVWVKDFDPMTITTLGSGEYTEGNAWHYTFFAPQDVNGLMELYGGPGAFAQKIDDMWEQEAVNDNEHASDVTGLIGQYAHGNEPSHHVAYLYNYAGQAQKTQKWVRHIMETQYANLPDGLSGNEDCGQMSAWYTLSAMGMYSVNPASGIYLIGSPVFNEIQLKLENGQTFTVKAENNSPENIYIQSAKLNGENYHKAFIHHADIMAGGTLEFVMGAQPSDWGNVQLPEADVEKAFGKELYSEDQLFMPYTASDQRIFTDDLKVELGSIKPEAKIYYTLDGSSPTTASSLYQLPIHLTNSAQLQAISVLGEEVSPVFKTDFNRAIYHIEGKQYPILKLTHEPDSKAYNPGKWALLDGVSASANLRDGKWSGFSDGHDLEAVIDLGTEQHIAKVSTGFLRNTSSWVFLPVKYEVFYSEDGKKWQSAGFQENAVPDDHQTIRRFQFAVEVGQTIRYLKVVATTMGDLPEWHPGFGNASWMFADEIVIEPENN